MPKAATKSAKADKTLTKPKRVKKDKAASAAKPDAMAAAVVRVRRLKAQLQQLAELKREIAEAETLAHNVLN